MKTQQRIQRTLFLSLSILMIVSFSCQTSPEESEEAKGIVGRWERVKRVYPDGSDVMDGIHVEHYYDDGTLVYVAMMLEPTPLDTPYVSTEELKAAFRVCIAGIATYEVDEENGILSWTPKAASDPEDIGKTYSGEYKLSGDTLIFKSSSGDYYFVRK